MITEAQVKEIHEAESLIDFPSDELRAADAWLKQYALAKLNTKLREIGTPSILLNYTLLMARCHYGSVETDEFLKSMGCYPDWL